MDTLIQSLPFITAISLLVFGTIKRRRFLFIASFVVLVGACFFALAASDSSAVFGFMGGFVLILGLACLVLSRRLQPGGFVSQGGLRALGALFFFLGFAGLMIV